MVQYRKKRQNRVLLHTLFWLISIVANAYVFKLSSQLSWLDVYYSIFSHLCLLIGSYINVFMLVPILFSRQKYFLYTLAAVVNAMLMTLVYLFTFNELVDWVMPNYYFVSQFNWQETFIFVLAYLSFTTLLNLSESWFELQEKNKQMLLTEKESIDNQLKALKTQINPHFLFNSLNVIYSEALKNSNQVPEIVIKLSDILRYVIYKSKNDTIKISEEIELINNYIQLQKYRVDSTADIYFKSDFDIDHNIAPMLFLPLIENSFKHGIKGELSNTYIHIDLISNNETTQFIIENNKGSAAKFNFDKEGGIGLENVKKRLLLLYPNRHKFLIQENDDNFKIDMKLYHN